MTIIRNVRVPTNTTTIISKVIWGADSYMVEFVEVLLMGSGT